MLPLLCLALALAPVVQDPSPPRNLLVNPGAEQGDRRPEAWQKGDPVPGVRYLWETGEAAEGKRSLGLHKTVDRYFPIAAWQQDVAHDGSAQKLHFGGLVRAKGMRKATLDVAFLGADGKWTHAWAAYIGARKASDPPADHDWQWYSGVVEVPPRTTSLRFGLQVYGPGQVWFDRLLATFVGETVAVTEAARLAPQPADSWGQLPAAVPPAVAAEAPQMRTLDGDPLRTYALIAPRGAPRDAGHGLLVVLPGGDGSADFAPFVQRIAENAAPADYVVVQAVAPRWSGAKDLVWPKRRDEVREVGRAAAEDFVAAIVKAVREEHRIDADRIFLLGWSSGGPACYAATAEPDSPVRGAMVAMSVFRRDEVVLRGVKGKAFYVLHSPQDFIAMSFPERAVKDLAKAGAETTLATYEGGHGWHGDVYGNIEKGLRWLEANAARGKR
ncbi:MAG: PHB depolymerase family esterase [Planctomycetota bacterium]